MGVFRISAFGDEISDDLGEQLATLTALEIGWLELRAVWGKNVLHLSDDEVAQVGATCAEAGIGISTIGSPIGKSPLTEPLASAMAQLDRICAIANALDVPMVRVFSFYPPEGVPVDHATVLAVAQRLSALAARAGAAGIRLVLENERGIVGDTVARCIDVMVHIEPNALGFAWDPANFVHVGDLAAVDEGWAALGPAVQHVHVKDFNTTNGVVVPAGEGDGQVSLLLQRLVERGYDGFLALEPHLAYAGPRGGFSGPDGMARAAAALRALMAKHGVRETRPAWVQGK